MMKLRIKGNSIRYRLSQTDVDIFGKEGYLQETINFVGQPLLYILKQTDNKALSATYTNNMITMYMPVDYKNEWVHTNKVGYSNQYNELNLLVEKDFKCLDDVIEDQSDNYPNPLAKTR